MTRARMRSRLAGEWEAMGWEWDLQVGGLILDRIGADGVVDASAVAAALPASYLSRYDTDRETLAEVIDRALGGETLDPDAATTGTVVVNGDSFNLSFHLADNAKIENSPFNTGSGPQINLDAGAGREEFLDALRALLAAGLTGRWDPGAALALGRAIEEQGSLSTEDVRRVALEAGELTGADSSKVRELVEKVAVSGLGGFLATSLGSGLTGLMHLVGR
jgi:hypothetical protein